MVANKKRKEIIADLIESARGFRFCGPSDDPDEQTAVTSGYRYLVTQFKRLAAPVLASPSASRLNAIDVEIDNLYSAYDAKAELDALLPEIEAALQRLDNNGNLEIADGSTIVAESRLVELRLLVSANFDFRKLVRLCEEINSAYRLQCFYATAMLIRGILDHVPPVFGFKTFSEVANNYAGGGKSFEETMQHLENASRKVADAHYTCLFARANAAHSAASELQSTARRALVRNCKDQPMTDSVAPVQHDLSLTTGLPVVVRNVQSPGGTLQRTY